MIWPLPVSAEVSLEQTLVGIDNIYSNTNILDYQVVLQSFSGLRIQMYPPRKSYESNSNSKNKYVSGYVSPSNRDANKINRILENAKKYVNSQEQKKDYMSQGIMNLKKKEGEETDQNSKKRKSSEVSNKSSEKGEESKKDIYRKINSVDQEKQEKLNQGGRDKILSGVLSEKQDRSVKRLPNNQINEEEKKRANWQYRSEKPTYDTIPPRNQETEQKYPLHNHSSNSYAQLSMKDNNLKQLSSRQKQGLKNIQDSEAQRRAKSPQQAHQDFKYQYENVIKTQSPLSKIINPSERQKLNLEQNNDGYGYKFEKGNTEKSSNNQIGKATYLGQNQPIRYTNTNKEYDVNKVTDDNKKLILNTNLNLHSNSLDYQAEKLQGKVQVDKLTDEITELRRKYYKAEQQRVSIMEKFKVIQQDSQRLRNQNQNLIVKIKKMQFEMNSLENYRNIAETQIRQFQSNKEVIYDDVMQKINQLTNDLRKKSLEATNYERALSQMQRLIDQKDYDIKRVKQALMVKDQQILNLQEKQYQYNKLNSIHNKTQFEAKVLAERVTTLENQNSILRQQKASVPFLENQLSKNRKQIQQMIQDMKSLQSQLQQKDRLLKSYKSLKPENNEMGERESMRKQLQSIMKQKAEIVKKYEQKLIEKEKQIYQLEMQKQNKERVFPKLGGLQAQSEQFEKILANQLQEINKLKRENNAKISEVFSLKVELENIRYNLVNEQNKCRILTLQMESNSKNSSSLAQSQLRVAKNEIQSLNRRIQHMNNTIESKRRQNENKDEFIKKFLISQGITQQQDVSSLMGQLQKILCKRASI